MNTLPARPRVCVVGSSIMDLVCYSSRLPNMGETLAGTSFQTGFGGKGANQAVMASLLGAEVSMVSKLGNDQFGTDYRANFRDRDIDDTHVTVAPLSTGVASIWVNETSGDNAIVIVPGANNDLDVNDVIAARDVIESADIVVAQWEVPLECVVAAFRLARDAGARTVFNPAPAQGPLPNELCQLTDVFCPNESELALLTGAPVASLDEVEAAARVLLRRGAHTVVVTLGERGALAVDAHRMFTRPAPTVQPVDTTGAGDAFVASMSTMLAAGADLERAVEVAIAIASESVVHPGTQSSYPDHRTTPPWS